MDYIPTVSSSDIERLIRRDFDTADFQQISAILVDCSSSSEPYRVQAAVLKLACGSTELLRQAADMARKDFRDVLGYAEYPEAMSTGAASGAVNSPKEMAAICDRDWNQYMTWFAGESAPQRVPPHPESDYRLLGEASSLTPRITRNSFPVWAAPIVGMLLAMPGVLSGELDLAMGLGIGAGLGTLAGAIMWAFDKKA